MIAPVFYPYPPVWPEGMVNHKLALAMKNAGWHIDVIIAGNPAAKSRYPSDEHARIELSDHVHIVNLTQAKNLWHKVRHTTKGLFLSGRILKHLAWGMSVNEMVAGLHAKQNFDFILSRAIPDYAHFAALLVHRQTRIPWIANWNDPTPNHKFPPPYGDGPASPLRPDIASWYQLIGKHATWHTFPCERMRQYICSYFPGNIEARSSVVPHIAMGGTAAYPKPADDVFSLCYAGSISPPRDVNVFLEGVKRFVQSREMVNGFQVRFMVDKPEIVADCANSMDLTSIVAIEPSVPYTQMPKMLDSSDILVIIEPPLEEGIFMPSKIVDYAQIGRPILAVAPSKGTLNDVISNHGGGLSVDCRSPEAVAGAIETFYAHWREGSLDRRYGSSSLMSLFSEDRVLDLYAKLFNKIGDNPLKTSFR